MGKQSFLSGYIDWFKDPSQIFFLQTKVLFSFAEFEITGIYCKKFALKLHDYALKPYKKGLREKCIYYINNVFKYLI